MTRDPAVLGLRRTNLAERALLTLHRGTARNPDVLLVETEDGRAIVKDYAPRDPWVRKWLGPRLIAREARAYRQLADHPGRNEPGTGEVHYSRVLRQAHELGYRGFVGLECRPSSDEATAARRVALADQW